MRRRDLLGGIIAFLSFGLVGKASNASPKEKAPKWLKETEKESRESYTKRLENIAKAHEILRKYSDFTTQEAECVRKTICKRLLDYEEYKKRFQSRFVSKCLDQDEMWLSDHGVIGARLNSQAVWDAICVTFRTCGREDGFNLIDCVFPKETKCEYIAQFKRISLPLVRRIYPSLMI